MQYAALGTSGIQVSRLCLGMMSYGSPEWQRWTLPYEAAEHFVRRALEAGINFFDTADFYSYGLSEEFLGRAIAKLTSRENVVISTKVGLPMSRAVNAGGLSRKHVLHAIDESLRRLGTDHVDVYMLHEDDPTTPIEETLAVMADIVRSGRARYVGFSNLPAWKAAKAVYHDRHQARAGVRVAQLQYNLCYREEERDLLPLCATEGLGVMVYSPLARGWLAGNRRPGAAGSAREALRASSDAKAQQLYGTADDVAVLDAAAAIAGRRGIPVARLAMAWVLANPTVSSLISGVLEDQHLDEAVAALEVRLTDAELAELAACYRPQWPKTTALNAVMASK